jgi:hypothetical protein
MERKMSDVTAILLDYREALKDLWNKHFLPWLDEDYASHTIMQFRALESKLYECLVIDRLRLSLPVVASIKDYPSLIQVVPKSKNGCAIRVQRHLESGYWDDPFKNLETNECDLRFISFFDWSELESIGCEYCLVRVVMIPGQPQLAGREALIATADVNFAQVIA